MKLTTLQKHALRYLVALEPYSNRPQRRVIKNIHKKGLINKDLSVTDLGIKVLEEMGTSSTNVVHVDFVNKRKVS